MGENEKDYKLETDKQVRDTLASPGFQHIEGHIRNTINAKLNVALNETEEGRDARTQVKALRELLNLFSNVKQKYQMDIEAALKEKEETHA